MKHSHEDHCRYMHRCLQLAALGHGHVSPNPMVGAVVVHKGKIIGEGYHRRCGEAHAEVNAIRSVKNEELLRESTIYVSLEPCSHYGKTPPCCKLIIEKQIPRVVMACFDPFPEVSGRGVRMLREAGVEVITGVLEEEAIRLNSHFMTVQKFHRPYILLKWAQSSDGFIDRIRSCSESPVLFSNAVTLTSVHRLRAEYDAILVGTRTALYDDPSLTVRYWSGKNPLRLVIDRRLELPENLRLFSDGNPTLVITEKIHEPSGNIEYLTVDFTKPIIPTLLQELFRRKISSLLVEGGAVLLQSFIDSDCWDEIRIEETPFELKNGVCAPVVTRVPDRFFYSGGHLISKIHRR
ncbi:bifunctional diaminohydroxyphosphoribosylaminopyrimidine deaminase/5-amino-6-(5-phosphoribosylamino)uracil reductase RibD [Coprobacter fastidiosus]|mgnify:FL=1|uniref:bifunctional diaminohydroxyphosphoribosylaminopyrimidine deaminase/5-amino-6-(5-phosphoribosylamino)uracil reductase RibD n=1 Tax=Coprobacter fastidiosus TaxID=1099853 RepID=UPI00266F09B1|nr:bifunctional diaminohydroxyphosphoribosylaminopyrimidine deaminase/5-amino-6-(5-phosphoribosylamino)uracil reductase RibD [Coprobacter fastidiosus]